MRHIELQDHQLVITLTGLTMLEALQGRLVIPYGAIARVHSRLRVPPRLLRVGGATIGTIHEGHYVGDKGWYFLSYENPEHVITLDLKNFYIGRHLYVSIAVEVTDPNTVAEAIINRLPSP